MDFFYLCMLSHKLYSVLPHQQYHINVPKESLYYSINPNLNIKDFETELKKEYDFRLERRNEYLTKYKPMDDVTLFTEELLKQDYYYALLSYKLYSVLPHQQYHKNVPKESLYYKAY